jgi:hypothetical protein
MSASGTSGPLGAIADRFDQIPVRGKLMTTLVSVIALSPWPPPTPTPST